MEYVFPSDQDRANNEQLNEACEYIEHLLQQPEPSSGVPEGRIFLDSDDARSFLVSACGPEYSRYIRDSHGLAGDFACHIASLLTAAPTPEAGQSGGVPDYVQESLQRLIENGGQLGPASREDALVVAKHRQAFLTHPPHQPARQRTGRGVDSV